MKQAVIFVEPCIALPPAPPLLAAPPPAPPAALPAAPPAAPAPAPEIAPATELATVPETTATIVPAATLDTIAAACFALSTLIPVFKVHWSLGHRLIVAFEADEGPGNGVVCGMDRDSELFLKGGKFVSWLPSEVASQIQ